MILLLLALLAQDDLATADKAYREGRWAEAAGMFEKILEKQKTGPIYAALGHCRLELKAWDGAVEAFRQALALKAERPVEIHRAIAHAHLMSNRWEEAVKSFGRAQALDPEGTDGLSIARIHLERQAWFQAEHELAGFLRWNPGSGEGLELLAYLLSRAGKPAEAADVVRQLVQRQPLQTKQWIALGRAEAAARRYGEAIDALETARRLGARDEDAERLTADLYLHEQMPREAAAVYARIVAASTSPRVDDCLRLGHAYAQSREPVSAREAFLKALTIEPGNGAAQLGLGRLAASREDGAEARTRFTLAMKAMTDSAAPCLALGDLEVKALAWDAAAAAFREAMARGERASGVQFALAHALLQAGRRDDARAALKASLAEHPTDDRLRGLLPALDK